MLRGLRITKISRIAMVAILVCGIALEYAQKAAAAEKTFLIGIVAPMSGYGATYGEAMKLGAELSRDWINSQGGIKAGPNKGAQIKIRVYDSAADPKLAASITQKIISEDTDVLTVVGFVLSTEGLAAKPIAEANNFTFVSLGTALALSKDTKNVFCTSWSFNDSSRAASYHFVKKLGITKIALLTESGSFGEGTRQACLKYIKENGGQVVGDERFDIGVTKDFRSLLLKFKNAGAQTVFIAGGAVESAMTCKQAKDIGFDAQFCDVGGGSVNVKYFEVGGKDVVGTWALSGGESLPPKKGMLKWVADECKKRANMWPPHAAVIWTFDAMMAVLKAIELGANERNNMSEYMFKVKVEEAAGGPYAIGPDGRSTGKILYINRASDKMEWEPVIGYEVKADKLTPVEF